MAKVKVKTVVVKCQCTTCNQVAYVEEGTVHYHCNGIKLVKPLPAMFRDLKHPDPKRKGVWALYVEPSTLTETNEAIALPIA